MLTSRNKYKYSSLADFIEAAWRNKIAKEVVLDIIMKIRQGVGLAKRDRELAKFMEQAPPSIQDDPVYVKGYMAGYTQAADDHEAGMDIVAIAAEDRPSDAPKNSDSGGNVC